MAFRSMWRCAGLCHRPWIALGAAAWSIPNKPPQLWGMDWLHSAQQQQAAKIAKQELKQRLAELKHAATEHDGCVWKSCFKPLTQDTVHQRLPHIYQTIWSHAGVAREEALKRFWADVWPHLKTKVKRFDADHGELVQQHSQDWLASAAHALEQRIAASVEVAGPVVPGPAPVPEPAPRPVCFRALPPNKLLGEETASVLAFLAAAKAPSGKPPAKFEVMAFDAMAEYVKKSAGNVDIADLPRLLREGYAQSCLLLIDRQLSNLERHRSEHALWSGQQTRGTPTRTRLHAIVAFCAAQAKQFYEDLTKYETECTRATAAVHRCDVGEVDLSNLPRVPYMILLQGRQTFGRATTVLCSALLALANNYSHAWRQRRVMLRKKDQERTGFTANVIVNPNTIELPFDAALDRICDAAEDGAVHAPFSLDGLASVASIIRVFVTVRLDFLCDSVTEDKLLPNSTAEQRAEQLVEALPVMAVVLLPRSQTCRASNVYILSANAGCLQYLAPIWAVTAEHGKNIDRIAVEDEASDEADDAAGESDGRERRGRKRSENLPHLGEALVQHIKNFIRSRGQVEAADARRLRAVGETYGAPLTAIVESCRAHGFDISRSAVYTRLISNGL